MFEIFIAVKGYLITILQGNILLSQDGKRQKISDNDDGNNEEEKTEDKENER